MKNLKKFFIPYQTINYKENHAYIFVFFRIKRAGSSNSRGTIKSLNSAGPGWEMK